MVFTVFLQCVECFSKFFILYVFLFLYEKLKLSSSPRLITFIFNKCWHIMSGVYNKAWTGQAFCITIISDSILHAATRSLRGFLDASRSTTGDLRTNATGGAAASLSWYSCTQIDLQFFLFLFIGKFRIPKGEEPNGKNLYSWSRCSLKTSNDSQSVS